MAAQEAKQARQLLLVKIARAQLKRKRPREALAVLRRAQSLGETSRSGLITYWIGAASKAAGHREEAARNFTSTYTRAADPYQLAALYQLTGIYGGGSSNTAEAWRKRWNDSSSRSVFSRKFLPPPQGNYYSIQLGAFSTVQRAEAQAARARALGLRPVVLPAGADGLYRVRIVGLTSRREVKRITALLRKKRIAYHVISPGG